MKVTLLGCGGSEGVPSATGNWGVCDPENPRNHRRRPAVFIETEDAGGIMRNILIDTPPELRDQLARLAPASLDAVLMTHCHADHLHGLDDLRSFARRARQPIPVYGEAATIGEIRERFAYAVPGGSDIYQPIVMPHEISGRFQAAGIAVTAFDLDHGFGRSTGYRIGRFGYTIDVVRLSETAFDILAGIDLWIVDCQQLEPHPTHSHLAQTLKWIERIKPRRAVLTHLGARLDYAKLSAMLPACVEAGFDGLSVDI